MTETSEEAEILYEQSLGCFETEPEKAVNGFRRAAEAGLKEAQCNLAFCYEEGIGVGANFKLAFDWYSRAAQQDDPVALFSLGTLYMNGEGVKADETKAFISWKRSARQDYAPALKNLGCCYIEGVGTKRNIEKGTECLKKAAELGDEEAAEILYRLSGEE